MLCVCVGDVMDAVFSICIVRRGAVGARVSVSSCRCCMFVSCVHPVAVLNATFCMTCSLLQYSSLTILKNKYYEEVKPYRKTDYKPMLLL